MSLAPVMSRRTPVSVHEAREARAMQLRRQLSRSDMSRSEVAKMIGVKATRLSRWVGCYQPIPDEKWVELQTVLS